MNKKTLITQERLQEILEYDPDAGEFIWINPPNYRGHLLGCVAGSWSSFGYRRIKIDQVDYMLHRLVWLYVHGEWPENEIDHINGKPSDNRLINLRKATPGQNQYNRRIGINSKSGVKGVVWSKRDKLWYGKVKFNKKAFVKCFKTKEKAVEYVQKLRKELHGEFLNHGYHVTT